MGRGEGGAAGGAREEDLTARLGSLDYPRKEKESLKSFKQGGTRSHRIVESGHHVKAGLGEGKSRGREAAGVIGERMVAEARVEVGRRSARRMLREDRQHISD